jgi:predicted nucleic-acid-binding protein
VKALDTNILVRFLVRDDEAQADAVYRIFRQAESDKSTFFVPALVLLETIWVLESVYDISRHDTIDALKDLLQMPILEFEAHPAVRKFIDSAPESNTDLPDLLIGQTARHSGCERVLTFDKKASEFEIFELIQP